MFASTLYFEAEACWGVGTCVVGSEHLPGSRLSHGETLFGSELFYSIKKKACQSPTGRFHFSRIVPGRFGFEVELCLLVAYLISYFFLVSKVSV